MRFPLDLKSPVKYDVVGFGTNAVDYLIEVPHYPEFDSKVELVGYVQAAGGEVATAMAGLTRLGLKTAYIGQFGSDPEGDFGLQSLRDEGVDVSFARQIEGAKSQIAFIIIDVTNGERTVIWKRDKKLHYSENDIDETAVESTRVFHFTPHDTDASIRLAASAKKHGAIVSIDIDNVFDGIERLLPLVDILIASAEFPEKFTGTADRRKSLTELNAKFGSSVVGVTIGQNGSLILCQDKFIETPGMPVPGGCKDTTGAGDSFRAGFLFGLLKGKSVEETARIANAVASLKCRAVGARTALPTYDELERALLV